MHFNDQTVNNILVIASLNSLLPALLTTMLKSGRIMYSPWTLSQRSRIHYEINKNRKKLFIKTTLTALVIYGAFALLITRNITYIAEFTLLNQVFITYTFIYWVLLREKDR
jgi:hypothetical protein